MSAEVDGAGCHVDVHQVIDRATLHMILNPVHQVSAADVEDLDIGEGAVEARETGSRAMGYALQ